MNLTTCISGGERCKGLEFQRRHISRVPVAPPQSTITGLEISTISSSAIVFFLWFFSKKRSVVSRRKQRSALDQVSELDKGRIVAYRNCSLSFRKIGSRAGRNQTTVMRICDRWMQIVRMTVTDRSVSLRTVVQHIQSVTHHSVSARTIRCPLQQSGRSVRRPLIGLPLTQKHRRVHRQ
ncbi:transposable element Tcb1 transposase [Trichonephila clavipes]|nr:transposable element Tcb1 transposase [Trichonephila clavipes]